MRTAQPTRYGRHWKRKLGGICNEVRRNALWNVGAVCRPVSKAAEKTIHDSGHAFGYYDYGEKTGMSAAFSGKEATANYICAYVRGVLRGGFLHPTSERGAASLQDRVNKEKKLYIFVGLVCVREEYQGQGYMRKVLDLAFTEGDWLGVPVILETDAKSKCDKYVHHRACDGAVLLKSILSGNCNGLLAQRLRILLPCL